MLASIFRMELEIMTNTKCFELPEKAAGFQRGLQDGIADILLWHKVSEKRLRVVSIISF